MDINQLTHFFCDIDDFCNELNQHTQDTLLPASQNTSRRGLTRLQ